MTQYIRHHIDIATLLSFSAGTLNQALAATVATHVSACKHCTNELATMNLVGSTLLSDLPIPLQDQSTHQPTVRPDPPQDPLSRTRPVPDETSTFNLPTILQQHFGLNANNIPWRQLAPGVWHHRLALIGTNTGDLRLLKIAPGSRMLVHGHGGAELTLVLDGAFSDCTGEYLPGDIQEVGEEIEHCPIADKVSGCVCLIASQERAKFKGIIGKLVQAWTGL